MPKIALTAVLTAIVTTLVNRQYHKRLLEYRTAILVDRAQIQSRLSYNHGFGDGHALGVENERHHALLRATIPSTN